MKTEKDISVDSTLLTCIILLSCLSLLVLYSASGQNVDLLIRQSIRICIAFFVMYCFSQLPPGTLARWSPHIYLAGLALLALVLVFGLIGKGAQRWLDLGFFRFQPSEIMKLAVPMMVAWVLTRNPLPPSFKDLLVAFVIVAIPAAFVIVQPDLGTAILIAFSGVLVIFLSGMRWGQILFLVALLAIVAPILWTGLHDYQQRRVMTLFNPWSDPLGAGYHTIQSIIAIGSGGPYGKGWLNGSQSHLEFIPERNTDFIFAVFAEEFGLLGAALLLLLYVVLVVRCIMISFYAYDTYSRLLAGSIGLTFFFYLFVNIGMVSGILPVVGVPLPLMSYGGTSMVTLMAGFGILMSIKTTKRLMT